MSKSKQKAAPVVEVKPVVKTKGVGASMNENKQLSKVAMKYAQARIKRQEAVTKSFK